MKKKPFQWSHTNNVAKIQMFIPNSETLQSSQVAQVVKNLPANAGNIRDVGSIPGLGRSPGEGYGNPLQYSFLENPMDRGSWWGMVLRVAKRRT